MVFCKSDLNSLPAYDVILGYSFGVTEFTPISLGWSSTQTPGRTFYGFLISGKTGEGCCYSICFLTLTGN